MDLSHQEFIQNARESLSLQTAVHAETWGFGKEEEWSADLDQGIVVFRFADGTMASAPIQVIGTYNLEDGTFLWGWDHPSIPEPLREHARLAQHWGEQNKVQSFVSRKVQCSEDEAWSFAAVTNLLAEANGVYRGPSGSVLVFMTFGEIELESPS